MGPSFEKDATVAGADRGPTGSPVGQAAKAGENATRSVGSVGALVALSHFGVDLVGGGFSAMLPSIAERHQLSAAMVGVLVALYSVTALALQPALGGMADRRGAAPTTAVAAAAAATLLAFSAAAPNTVLLLAAVTIGGLAASVYHPAGAMMLRRGPGIPGGAETLAMAWYSAAGTAGLAVGPPAVLLVGGGLGRHAVIALAAPAVVVAAVVWRSSPRPTVTTMRPTPKGRAALAGSGPLRMIALVATLLAIATTTLVNTVPLWIADQPGRSSTDLAIGVALAGFSLAAAAGGILGGVLIKRDPAAHRHLPAAILAAGVTLGFSVLAEPGSPGSILALVMVGLLVGPAFPVMLIAAQDAAPDSPAVASGVVMGLPYGVGGVAFLGVSQINGALGFRAGLLAAAAILVPAAMVLARHVTPSRERPAASVGGLIVCGCAPASAAAL